MSTLDDESVSCRDTWPTDRARPKLSETFPKRGTSGHVAPLVIDIEHLPGEVVFPAGLSFTPSAPELVALQSAHFFLPDPKSDVQPTQTSRERAQEKANGDDQTNTGDPAGADSGQTVHTQITLPIVPLPEEAGRHELTLPRFPISVARASGQVHTLCTDPHVILVEDPLASSAAPEKEADPEPRVQMEVWTTMRDGILTVAWAVPLALLLAWLFVKYGGKLKKAPPPPPPVPPWETARQQLAALRARRLLEAERFEEQLDALCDILRQYLGGRFGFDGMECTTAELLRELSAHAPHFPEEQAVRTVLQRADLVKFARRAPSQEECQDALLLIERVIEKTRPQPTLDPRSQGAHRPEEARRG